MTRRDSKGRFVAGRHRRTRRNLAGFEDANGNFHPIRGSVGYSGAIAGDHGRGKPYESEAKKKRAARRKRK